MSRATDLLEKFAKPVYDDKPHVADLEAIRKNITDAIADLYAVGKKFENKADLVSLNKCIMGMRGTSMKAAALAANAKKALQG